MTIQPTAESRQADLRNPVDPSPGGPREGGDRPRATPVHSRAVGELFSDWFQGRMSSHRSRRYLDVES